MSKSRMAVGINSCFPKGVHSTSNLVGNNKTFFLKLFFSRRSIDGGGHALCNT